MKSFLSIISLCLVMAFTGTAQVLHGIVKTPGRLGNNGQVIAGKRISGVTIQIKGCPVTATNANGEFTVHLHDSVYQIQSVKKKGYHLVDPDAIARKYTYSSNPLILVMESSSQPADNKLQIERKIRRALQRQMKVKEDEIESLRKENQITTEEYRQRLQDLYTNYNNEALTAEMAERYSQTDYDQLDEFNQRISAYILDGRLTEADSLLSSRGDIDERFEIIRQMQEQLEDEQADLDRETMNLAQDAISLAQECENNGDHNKALTLYLQALELKKSILPPDSPELQQLQEHIEHLKAE